MRRLKKKKDCYYIHYFPRRSKLKLRHKTHLELEYTDLRDRHFNKKLLELQSNLHITLHKDLHMTTINGHTRIGYKRFHNNLHGRTNPLIQGLNKES